MAGKLGTSLITRPSLQITESLTAHDSDLSDPPSDIDDYEFDITADIGGMLIKSPSCTQHSTMGNSSSSMKRSAAVLDADSRSMQDSDPHDATVPVMPSSLKRAKLSKTAYSALELLPTEILNEIAFYVKDDQDFVSLVASCKALSQALNPAQSAIWKMRFLSLYDYPLMDKQTNYCVAYQLRRLVLGRFAPFVNGKDQRLEIQLSVLKDMIIETYLPAQPHLPAAIYSRNLAAFGSPQNSPWMHTFLSTPVFPHERRRGYGQPHPEFDTLQVMLSHLVLSPASKMAHAIDSSRANYDLVRVYLWNQPLTTLYRRIRVERKEEDKLNRTRAAKRRSPYSRGRSSAPTPPVTEFRYQLDIHSLLHIRNFFQRHLIDDSGGFVEANPNYPRENTYAKMARTLNEAGITPQKWDKPITGDAMPVATEWYGHYSCLHPWPKTRQQLEEGQTCAEDWNSVDPLVRDEFRSSESYLVPNYDADIYDQKLVLSVSKDNVTDGFWPPIFSSIPLIDKTTPNVDTEAHLVIQGLAAFVELDSISERRTSTGSQSSLTVPKLPKYHPYQSLRVRGVIHPIGAQPDTDDGGGNDSIPGWNRIVMVMYKPSRRYLIQVLEYSEENYGDHFGPVVSTQLTQSAGQNQAGQSTTANDDDHQQNNNVASSTPTTSPTFDTADAELHLQEYLTQKLLAKPEWRDPKYMDPATIERMERDFRHNYAPDWGDIEYAYAYEGIIIPGGKIMMGRWWRCGMFGEGEGKELGCDGVPIEIEVGDEDRMDTDGSVEGSADNDADAAHTTANRASASVKLERGPFVFWCS